jgi:hypothetical protein
VNDLGEVLVPWADLPQRWGHPWHRMCSYLGTFPGALARSLLSMLSDEGDVILDPFSGRGTTLLEARLTGRVPLASDLNPIAVALSRAKNASVSYSEIIARLDFLQQRYDPRLYEPEANVESDNILLIFHPKTLAQLCYLRRKLVSSESPVDEFLIGCVLGIMHGSERTDGTSSYASISMPNTYSMPPNYVRRFVETKRLQRVPRDVFDILRQKAKRLCLEGTKFRTSGVVERIDAKRITMADAFASYRGRVRLVLGSPPYLDVVNYARQNWIRAWFLDEHPETVSEDLDDNLTLSVWLDFAEAVAAEIKGMLMDDGVAVLVIGDVAWANRSIISLAREFIRRLLHNGSFSYVGCLSDRIQTDVKTTRIWKETKGRATAVDRLIVLSNSPPEFRCDRLADDLQTRDKHAIPMIDAVQLREYAAHFAGA